MLDGYFVLSGRIRRWRFFLYLLVLNVIIVPVMTLLAIPAVNNAPRPGGAALILTLAITAFWLWAGFALVVKRLHDLNKPGWHYVWMFLLPLFLTGGFSIRLSGGPSGHWSAGYGQSLGIISVIALIYLLFARGGDGPNDYGYPP